MNRGAWGGYSPWVAKLDRAEGLLSLSTFYMVQLSRLYMTTGKAIALAVQTFVGKVMSLLFNMLSRFSHGFLPRSKCFLISWLQSLYATI